MRDYACTLKHVHMPVMNETKRTRRPRDPNQLAKLIADIAAGETPDRLMLDDGRDLAAVLMGRKGGLKGGKARAKALSPEQRADIARRAAQARWGTKGTKK
ncbi:histone H1 [Mesorhizobium sp. M1142]|uniref:histone H1 n=1 Tax=Mesorhizobium sp. M1142 TaxID=2957060 RepID=UPI003337D2B8